MEELRLFDLPHRAARHLAESGAPVYLLVNPVEYHGPHLPLHTDRILSRALARDLAERLATHRPEWPLVLADDLELGVEPTPGPGSRAVPFPIVRDEVVRAASALFDLGARRLVVMTFHGNPLHSLAIDAGVRAFEARGGRGLATLPVLLERLLTIDAAGLASFAAAVAHVEPAAERERMLAELPLDFHAGFFETSLMLHYAPKLVSPAHLELPPCPAFRPEPTADRLARVASRAGAHRLAAELRFAAHGLGWQGLRPFPGYTGAPALATAAAGAVFATAIVDGYAEAARAVFERGASPPRPIMAWSERLSLGGRLGGAGIRLEDVASLAVDRRPE